MIEIFTARRNARIASALLATAIPSVCPSVCVSLRASHASIVSKRRHVARCSLHCWIELWGLTPRGVDFPLSFQCPLAVKLLNGKVCECDFAINTFEYGNGFDIVG